MGVCGVMTHTTNGGIVGSSMRPYDNTFISKVALGSALRLSRNEEGYGGRKILQMFKPLTPPCW